MISALSILALLGAFVAGAAAGALAVPRWRRKPPVSERRVIPIRTARVLVMPRQQEAA